MSTNVTSLRTKKTKAFGPEYGACSLCPDGIDARIGTVLDDAGVAKKVPQIRCRFQMGGDEWVSPVVCGLMSSHKDCFHRGIAERKASTAEAIMERYWKEHESGQSSIPRHNMPRKQWRS